MAHTVALVLTDHLPVFEFAVPCEVFGIDRSDIVSPWYELKMCAAEPGTLRTTGGLRVDTPYGLDDIVAADTVLVPGCQRTLQIDPPEGLLDVLRAAHARGARVASICAGAYLLAAAGLLDGRRATTHWMNAPDFTWRFPAVKFDPGVLYVDEGDVLTSAGLAAGIDLCLHVIRADHGVRVANRVARHCVVPPWREGGQAQFIDHQIPVADEASTAATRQWALRHLDGELTVEQLARRAHMSPRTFNRRFREETGQAPGVWIRQQRLDRARELLETRDLGIDEVARLSGLGTAGNLRHHLRRGVGMSPSSYRRVYQGA